MISSALPERFEAACFDQFSLQVSEIQSLLGYVIQYGDFTDEHTPNAVSALERLVKFLQADIQAYHSLYMQMERLQDAGVAV